MAARGQLALRRQLQRELQHKLWLERNLVDTALLERCELRIEKLRYCLSSYDQ
jgi:hypothetical protein